MRSSLLLSGSLLLLGAAVEAGMPDKIYGVNLGSWLVLEPWMLPQEWQKMGGDVNCSVCSECIGSEFPFAKAYPHSVDEQFDKHWTTWFTQDDVDTLKSYGINTVRIPLGYWIVEALVERSTEFYPRGGLPQLIRGLRMLKTAGIQSILDLHAPPGVQDPEQSFTGHCTTDVEFYTPHNYQRALTWAAVMTALAHLHQDFSSVFAIEAVNEPIMNASQTPGYGEYQKNFVTVVRAVELAFGIKVTGIDRASSISSSNTTEAISDISQQNDSRFNEQVQTALRDAIPILVGIASSSATKFNLGKFPQDRQPLVTNQMDVNWQNTDPPNPADAAIGPQAYDNHLYYVFGGVADPNEDAYLTSICNLNRVQADKALGNSPLWFGEWGLPTQFDASDAFLKKWADAQKLAYSQGAGWIFWNFKIEHSALAGNLSREWSYIDGVKLGYLTVDPSQVHNASVCKPYVD